MLLTSRQLLQAKALDIENDLRGTLHNFGLKVGRWARSNSRPRAASPAMSSSRRLPVRIMVIMSARLIPA
jgi:hypothetical protein